MRLDWLKGVDIKLHNAVAYFYWPLALIDGLAYSIDVRALIMAGNRGTGTLALWATLAGCCINNCMWQISIKILHQETVSSVPFPCCPGSDP